jgi:O-antigen/teichoic acid export membrane protein
MNWPRFVATFRARLKASSYWQDVAWLMSGTVVAQIVTFVFLPIFSRLFRPADFALMNLFMQIVVLVMVVTIRFEWFVQLPKHPRDGWRVVQLVAGLGLFSTVILTPTAWFGRHTFARWAGEPALAPWMVWVPLASALTSMAFAFQGWEQRWRRFRRSSEAEVVGKFGYAGSVLLGWLLLPGAGGLVLGSGLGTVVGKLAWLVRPGRKGIPWNSSAILRVACQLGKLAGSVAVSHTMLACTAVIPLITIAHAYGPDVLGQFALANQSVYLPSALLGAATSSVYYQRACALWSQGCAFSGLWRSTTQRMLIVGLPIYFAAFLLLPVVFPFVFGGKWHLAGHFAGILTISSFFGFLASPIERGCLVVGAWWYIPLWHATRMVSQAILGTYTVAHGWPVSTYLYAFTALSALMYAIDFVAETVFAFQQPPRP